MTGLFTKHPLVKICGITQADTITEIVERRLSVDWLGFVFAPSRRQVAPSRWQELAGLIPSDIKTVGVFVDPALEEIAAVFNTARLDIVQLHSEASPAFCQRVKEQFGCQLIKVFGINEPGGMQHNSDNPCDDEEYKISSVLDSYLGIVDYVLLDTVTTSQAGGTGKAFAWDEMTPYRAWCETHGLPLIVAGGINERNVAELVRKYNPDGIDVSSGVETDGRKDADKIQTLIERALCDERSRA
ncbi:phosphoribosylanthranilate isomerase [Aneurinibacillus terranovensis]|uniref:phosphoribosylanthranilate isomerase n=1 Tax=Aneurinibacillus terranovensis TaxID=278991 RepID=UPI0003FDA8D2|nr:phosphoribosylanthranilate isomerase [Aneurinibacillus terranovensis]